MYETGRRAHRAQALCPQRLDWYASVPDSREDFELGLPLESIYNDTSEPPGSWFKVKSFHGFQHPSIVLVEKIVRRDDVEDESCHRHLKQKHLAPVSKEFGENDPQCATTPHDHQKGERSTSLRDSIPFHSPWWIKRKRTKTTNTKTTNNLKKVVKVDWKHGSAVRDWKHGNAESADTGGLKTIDEGLQNDGLGRISNAASSLAVIRRMELDAEGFFEFLFSDRWKEGCLLRVLRGKLLDDLLHTLNQLLKNHDVVCHSTMAYTRHQSPLVPCNKMHAGKEIPDVVEDDVLVELDCFHPQRPKVVKQQSHTLEPPGTVIFESHISDPAGAVAFESHTLDPAEAVAFESHTSNPAGAVPFKSLMLDPQRAVRSQSPSFSSLEVLPSPSYRSDPTESSSQCQSILGTDLSRSVILDQPAAFMTPSVLSDPLGAVMSPSLWSDPLGAVTSSSLLLDQPEAVKSWPHMLDRPGAVMLQSALFSSLEVLPSQSYRLDPTKTSSKCPSISDATGAVTRQSGTVGITCNIRGHLKPPPHSDCFIPYHAVREPFQLRRYRQQSSLLPHTLPELHGPRLSASEQCKRSEDQQLQDSAFLGSIFEDGTEPVSTDVFLRPIPQQLNDSQEQQNRKKSSPEKEKTAKKKKGKKNKKEATNPTSDEDSDTLENTQVRSWIDPSRVDRLKKDLEQMSTELMAKQLVPKREKEAIQTRLRRELGILRDKRRNHTSTKEAAVKQMEQATVGEPAGQSAQESSATQELPIVSPPLMRQWSRCPTFVEFYNYLEREKGKKKKSCTKKKTNKTNSKTSVPRIKIKLRNQSHPCRKFKENKKEVTGRKEACWKANTNQIHREKKRH